VADQGRAAHKAGDGLPPTAGALEFVAGDFFRDVPPGGDVYLMRDVLHNWDDDQCVAILGNVRRAVAETATASERGARPRVAVIEMQLTNVRNTAMEPAHMLNLIMLAQMDGRERPKQEVDALMAAAGLEEAVPPVRMGPALEALQYHAWTAI